MNLIASTSYHPSTRHSVLISPPLRLSVASGLNPTPFPNYPLIFQNKTKRPLITFAKKKNLQTEPVVYPSIIDEVSTVGDEEEEDVVEDDIFLEGFQDDELVEDDGDFGDDYLAEEAELFVGDGAGGGGISLAGSGWDKRALEIAEQVRVSFDGELGIYAFRTLLNATIQVRIERLTNESGSPSMTDIEDFTKRYKALLDVAEPTGSIPGNIILEVSSPGVERVVRVPQDLERFKDRNLYVKYVTEVVDTDSSSELIDGVFRLISYDSDASTCTWGLANVRVNREKSGKGRPLNKKQKEWRLNTPFDSLSHFNQLAWSNPFDPPCKMVP